MEIGGSNYIGTNAPRPTGQTPANVIANRLGETVSGLAPYDQRLRPSTFYPKDPEPIMKPDGRHFFLEFPEIRLTPKLAKALSESVKIDFMTKDTEIKISDRGNGIKIKTIGGASDKWILMPLAARLFAMLQAGLTPDEYADLLVVFDGQYQIMADGKGGVGFLSSGNRNEEKYPTQYDIANHKAKCIEKLLELKCPDLAKDALVMMYNEFLWHVANRPGDLGVNSKDEIRGIIFNRAWKGWAETALATIE